MPRIVRKRVTFFSFAILTLAIVALWRATPATTAHASIMPAAVGDVPTAMMRAGLDAASLTAAGVVTNQLAPICALVQAQIAGAPTAISDADSSYASARQAADAMQRKIASGLATQDEIASYPSLVSTLASATTTRQAAIDAVFTAGTKSLAPTIVAKLSKSRVNHAAWDLPMEFLLVDHTQQDWVTLRDALANEKITAKYGDSPDASLQSKLATWRADPDVSSAKSNLNANLAAEQAAWNSAAQ